MYNESRTPTRHRQPALTAAHYELRRQNITIINNLNSKHIKSKLKTRHWACLLYIFIHQKMTATKQIRKNKKLDSEHNIENTVTYTPT